MQTLGSLFSNIASAVLELERSAEQVFFHWVHYTP